MDWSATANGLFVTSTGNDGFPTITGTALSGVPLASTRTTGVGDGGAACARMPGVTLFRHIQHMHAAMTVRTAFV
jgi:hypothetical protein